MTIGEIGVREFKKQFMAMTASMIPRKSVIAECFFQIAMGSVRECQGALILADLENSASWTTLDAVAASLHRLLERAR